MSRTYVAIYGEHTEFTFESEHKAGSDANMQDAIRAAHRKFSKPYKGISGIELCTQDSSPIGFLAPADLDLTGTERTEISAALADGRIKQAYIGAKYDGLTAFGHIKSAHGWSWNEFQRAVAEMNRK